MPLKYLIKAEKTLYIKTDEKAIYLPTHNACVIWI